MASTIFIIVVITTLVGFTLTAYLTLLQSQNTATMRSQSWNGTVPVVEAGIEDALTHLNAHGTTNLACDGWSQAGNVYFMRRYLGQSYYIVTISNWFVGQSNPPVVESRGYVSTPTLLSSGDWPLLADPVSPSTVTTNYLARGVRCSTYQQFLFTKAMVAKGNINLSGQNVRTDSFDSGNTNYSTNGRYDASKAKDGGDVATDSSLTNSLSVGNANIFGRVSTGPGGSVAIGANGAVGPKVWQNAGNKGIYAGWSTDDMNVDFPDVIPPFTVAVTPIKGSYLVGGVTYDYVIGSGNSAFIATTLSCKVLITGNANVYVGPLAGISLKGGSDGITIQTNASLNIYADTSSVDISGQGVQNQGYANQFYYWGTPRNTSLNYGGNSAFTGVFYAPSAAFTLGGGGSTVIDFSGSSITGTIKMNGNYTFHYDESLGRTGKARGFVITSWNEMTPQEVATLPSGVSF